MVGWIGIPIGTSRYLCRGGTIEFFESGWLAAGTNLYYGRAAGCKASVCSRYILKGLILAQNERWRRGLGMQVAGIQQWGTGVRGSNAWVPTLGSGIAVREGG